MQRDRHGNIHASDVPYARGDFIRATRDDFAKLRHAWDTLRRRAQREGLDSIYNFSGLERRFDGPAQALAPLDDEIAPALLSERLERLALDHLGGDPDRHAVAVFNRQTAAILAATLVMVAPGETVIGVSPTHSHPCILRAARRAGARFRDVVGAAGLERALGEDPKVGLVALTRLAVSYEILGTEEIARIVDLAHRAGARVLVDDAGGARVGPAVFDQPRTLELGVEVGSTGLDKYGTVGPRLGLLGGERELVDEIRALAFELGAEARPMLYPAVVRSLEQYDPERVRCLVETTRQVTKELKARFGNRVTETPVIAKLLGEDILEMAMERAGLDTPPVKPIEATAGLAMILLRDYGVLTVHFAGVPPGTSAMLIKFVPPETLARFGGAARFAEAVDRSIDRLAEAIGDRATFAHLLYGTAEVPADGP